MSKNSSCWLSDEDEAKAISEQVEIRKSEEAKRRAEEEKARLLQEHKELVERQRELQLENAKLRELAEQQRLRKLEEERALPRTEMAIVLDDSKQEVGEGSPLLPRGEDPSPWWRRYWWVFAVGGVLVVGGIVVGVLFATRKI